MSEKRSGGLKVTYPVARPAVAPPEIVAAEFEEPLPPLLFTREMIKGLATSLILHSMVLIGLAYWYFAPKVAPQVVLNSRLIGSEMGVDDGLTITGGMNTPIIMPEAPRPEPPDPMMSTIKPLDVAPLELKHKVKTGAPNTKASAEGGFENKNPGAGNNDGFGLAKFGQGGESVQGVTVKVGDPQFTLIWDTDADLDLHVIEPGGKEIYWEDPHGKPGLGGELDVDNTKGFGPENIYWLKATPDGEMVKGAGPAGVYRWFVVYWGGFGGVPKPTRWKVRIKHNGQVSVVQGKFRSLNERSRVNSFTFHPSAADASTESAAAQ